MQAGLDDANPLINNLMPAPWNEWGCEQLKKRFGQDRAPFGCVAADYTSWK